MPDVFLYLTQPSLSAQAFPNASTELLTLTQQTFDMEVPPGGQQGSHGFIRMIDDENFSLVCTPQFLTPLHSPTPHTLASRRPTGSTVNYPCRVGRWKPLYNLMQDA